MAAIDNISDRVRRVRAARFVENGGESYSWTVPIPEYAFIEQVSVVAEAAWEDGTAAVLDAGVRYYEWDGDVGRYVEDTFDDDDTIDALDLISLSEGDTYQVFGFADMSGNLVEGARYATVPRDLVFTVAATDGDGAEGRSVVLVSYSQPVLEAPSVT